MIILDDSNDNADWIKWRKLDIPGIKTFEDVERMFKFPKQQPERGRAIRRFVRDHVWVNSMPLEERKKFDIAITERTEKDDTDE